MPQQDQKKLPTRQDLAERLDTMVDKLDNLERLSVGLIERLEHSESERKTLKNVVETFYNINYDKIQRARKSGNNNKPERVSPRSTNKH